MKSTANLAGHPLHPVLIPYPFAFLTGATAFDVASSISGRPQWSQTASHLARIGLGSAVVAAIPGIIDYFGSVPPGTEAKTRARYHALTNVSALACFAIAESRRGADKQAHGLAFSVLGTALLSIGGWLGGELIYHHHIAVDDGIVQDWPSVGTDARLSTSAAGSLSDVPAL